MENFRPVILRQYAGLQTFMHTSLQCQRVDIEVFEHYLLIVYLLQDVRLGSSTIGA